MRKYQPIWEELKVNFIARVRAEESVHRRIIKAVRKEKANDHAWKLQNKRYKLTEEIDGMKITFILKEDTSTYISDMKL